MNRRVFWTLAIVVLFCIVYVCAWKIILEQYPSGRG